MSRVLSEVKTKISLIFTIVIISFHTYSSGVCGTPNNEEVTPIWTEYKVKSKQKEKWQYVNALTWIVQSSGDARRGPLGTELGHATVSLHSERVVEMRIQVGNNNRGLLQVCRAWLEVDLLVTGDARAPVTVLTHHAVGEVTTAPRHERWVPGQLQFALCWQGSGA